MSQFSLSRLWSAVQTASTLAAAYLTRFLGGRDALLGALLALMALDYLSGVMNAFARRRLSSAVGFAGICKKALILMLVGVSAIVDLSVLRAGGALRGAVIGFYLSNEALSLFENAAKLGLPVPERLKSALSQLRGGDGGDGGEKSR